MTHDTRFLWDTYMKSMKPLIYWIYSKIIWHFSIHVFNKYAINYICEMLQYVETFWVSMAENDISMVSGDYIIVTICATRFLLVLFYPTFIKV